MAIGDFMFFCFFISRRLTAYVENEVSLNEREGIDAHLNVCNRCRSRVNHISRRINLIQQLPLLKPDDTRWTSIANNLYGWNVSEPLKQTNTKWHPFTVRNRFLKVAVMTLFLLVFTVILFPAIRSRLQPVSNKRELNLAAYLDLVGTASAAESNLKEFPVAPGFKEVSRSEAEKEIGFPVIAPETLPGGYKLTAIRLYTRGDFRALQLKYQSERDGLCVFQLASDSTLSFGGQSSNECEIDGIRCRRLNDTSCIIYPFTVGRTQSVLIMSQRDSTTVDGLIQTFENTYHKSNQK